MKPPQSDPERKDDKEDDHIYDGHDHDHEHDHDAPKPPKGGKPGKAKREGPPTEDDLQRQLTMLEVARNRIEAFSREAEVLGGALRDHSRATETLKAIRAMGKKPNEVLLPVGAGVFIYAKPSSTNEVLMNIGNGVTAEYDIKDATEKLSEALKDLEDKEKKIVAELERLEIQAEALTREAQGMYEEMQRARNK